MTNGKETVDRSAASGGQPASNAVPTAATASASTASTVEAATGHDGHGQRPVRSVWRVLDHTEEFLCAVLLVGFVSLLFAQIVSRQLFRYTILWADELATHMFVWFAYFGAAVAAKLSAHNRVTFQFTFFPPIVKKVSEGLADLVWVAFNLYFAWLCIDFIFFRMNRFWSSQTLGLPMKYFYLVLPVAFVLMSVRILINDYRVLVRGEALQDPEQAEIERLAHQHQGE